MSLYAYVSEREIRMCTYTHNYDIMFKKDFHNCSVYFISYKYFEMKCLTVNSCYCKLMEKIESRLTVNSCDFYTCWDRWLIYPSM
jgi:hypothetical protein